ncbi:hypothetical protein ACO0K1_10860 [Undibacterium sp. SXout20W]
MDAEVDVDVDVDVDVEVDVDADLTRFRQSNLCLTENGSESVVV